MDKKKIEREKGIARMMGKKKGRRYGNGFRDVGMKREVLKNRVCS